MWRFNIGCVAMCFSGACQSLPEIQTHIVPESPTTGDILYAKISIVGEEAASDEVRPAYAYIYEWLLNGESADMLESDFLLADFTSRGDEWTIKVTPAWGARQGMSVTSSPVVVRNGLPQIQSIALDPPEPGAHQDILAVVDAVDPDGEPPVLDFSWFKNDILVPEATDAILPASYTAMDDVWKVSVFPRDAFDLEMVGSDVTATTIVGNGAPIVESVLLWVSGAPGKVSFQAGDTLEAGASVVDAEGDLVSVEYFWFVNEIAQNSLSSTTMSPSFFKKGDTVRVRATASDDFLESEPNFSDDVVIANSPPSIQLAQLSPNVIKEDTNALCEGLGFKDEDGDVPDNLYTWEVDGVDVGVSGDTLTGASFDKGQSLRCCVEPFDGIDSGTSRCSEPRTILNSTPTLSTAGIQPSSPSKASILTVDLTSSFDADGDDVTALVIWYLNGSPVSTASTLDLSDVNFKKGQKIRASVRPHDGTEAGAEVTTSEVIIQNAVPVLEELAISPATLFTDDVATASVVASDLDADAFTLAYEWKVGTSLVGTSSSLDGSTSFSKGDVLSLTVTPSDSETGASLTSAAVTIQNSPPKGVDATIEPDKPVGGVDDLLCGVATAAMDADGDAVQYTATWMLDGSAFSTTTTTTWPGDTVVATNTSGEDTWTCTLTPSDGVTAGLPAVASVELSNPWDVINAGGRHSCGMDSSGSIDCWGDNTDGQTAVPSGVYDSVATGGFHTCSISSGFLTCWGRDTDDQVSDAPTTGNYVDMALGLKHSCSRNSSGNLDCWGRDLSGCTSPPFGSYSALSVGDYHGCALDTSGKAHCWGRDVDGESTPPSTTNFAEIAAGGAHTCAIISATGGLDCWGLNTSGVTSAPATTGYQSIACGKSHCCAVTAAGGLDCWGDDSSGQASPPTSIGWAGITAGRYHSCAWTTSGVGACWGQNTFLQSTVP